MSINIVVIENTIKAIRPFFVPYSLQIKRIIQMIVKGIKENRKRVIMAFKEANPSMPSISESPIIISEVTIKDTIKANNKVNIFFNFIFLPKSFTSFLSHKMISEYIFH